MSTTWKLITTQRTHENSSLWCQRIRNRHIQFGPLNVLILERCVRAYTVRDNNDRVRVTLQRMIRENRLREKFPH